jgi:hypothetical protein
MWDLTTGDQLMDVGLPLKGDALAFDKENVQLAVSSNESDKIVIYALQPRDADLPKSISSPPAAPGPDPVQGSSSSTEPPPYLNPNVQGS